MNFLGAHQHDSSRDMAEQSPTAICRLKMIALLWILLSAIHPQEVASEVILEELEEGRNLELSFVYPFASNCTYKLSFRNSVFDTNGTSNSSTKVFSTSQHERTQVEIVKVFGTFVVRLRINSVQLSDRGVFSCAFHCPELRSVQSYRVEVIHPPRLISCMWLNETRVKLENRQSITSLKCSSTQGYPEGTIFCNTKREGYYKHHLPKFSSGKGIIYSLFWLPKDLNITCCAINRNHVQQGADCKDFVHIVQSEYMPTTERNLKSQDIYHSTARTSSKGTYLQPNLILYMVWSICILELMLYL